MGKKFIIDKIMSGLVGIFSTVVMLFAIMFAIVRETRWPFLIVAALTCPLWHWLLRKYILKDKLLPLWLIRGGAILAGCIFFVYASAWFPFYSCMDVMIEDRMKTQYEEIIKTETTEFVDVTGIEKELVADYYKIKASVNYKDTKTGEKKSEEVGLYFDRYKGQYFANFENMRKYRQHYWDYAEGTDISMFEQDQVNDTMTKFGQCLRAGDFDATKKMMCDALKHTITKEQWKQWQTLLADKGEFMSVKSPASISLDYETEDGTADGKRIGQLLNVSWVLELSQGEVTINAVIGEDLLFRKIEIQA